MRPPEDRIAAPFNAWIWSQKQFEQHEPTEKEIEEKIKELVSGLQTREEYEQQLIDEIERDIRDKERRI